MKIKILHDFKVFKESVLNLIYWFPIIWRDRPWDHSFFLDMLEHKLKQMSKYFKEDTIICTEEAKDNYTKMDRCIELIGKVRNYETEAFEPFYTQYPHVHSQATFEPIELDNGWKGTQYKSNFTEDQEKLFKECTENEPVLYKKHSEELFLTISQELLKWWD